MKILQTGKSVLFTIEIKCRLDKNNYFLKVLQDKNRSSILLRFEMNENVGQIYV